MSRPLAVLNVVNPPEELSGDVHAIEYQHNDDGVNVLVGTIFNPRYCLPDIPRADSDPLKTRGAPTIVSLFGDG